MVNILYWWLHAIGTVMVPYLWLHASGIVPILYWWPTPIPMAIGMVTLLVLGASARMVMVPYWWLQASGTVLVIYWWHCAIGAVTPNAS